MRSLLIEINDYFNQFYLLDGNSRFLYYYIQILIKLNVILMFPIYLETGFSRIRLFAQSNSIEKGEKR